MPGIKTQYKPNKNTKMHKTVHESSNSVNTIKQTYDIITMQCRNGKSIPMSASDPSPFPDPTYFLRFLTHNIEDEEEEESCESPLLALPLCIFLETQKPIL